MKTDIYGLLGMIKDGKAPRKIVFKEDIYEYRCSECIECIDYYCDNDGSWLFEDYEITSILNDEVTILETTITYKQEDIEKAMKSVEYVKEKLFPIIDEIEKIEKKDDKIEKVDEPYESCIFKTDYEFATELEKKIIDNIELIRKKQDEIIDKVNSL